MHVREEKFFLDESLDEKEGESVARTHRHEDSLVSTTNKVQ